MLHFVGYQPGHVGANGNEGADAAAKAALTYPVSNCKVPFSDAKQYIDAYVYDQWRRNWSSRVHNKLHAVNPTMERWSHACQHNLRDEADLTLLKIGHTCHTHTYLLRNEDAPQCRLQLSFNSIGYSAYWCHLRVLILRQQDINIIHIIHFMIFFKMCLQRIFRCPLKKYNSATKYNIFP